MPDYLHGGVFICRVFLGPAFFLPVTFVNILLNSLERKEG